MSSLARRVATAAVLVPVVVLGVLMLPTPYFGGLMALFVLAGSWEWADLSGYPAAARAAYTLVMALLLLGAGAAADNLLGGLIISSAGVVFWIGAVAWVARYQSGNATPVLEGRGSLSLIGVLVLVPAWTALYLLHGAGGFGPERVLLLMLLVWGADIGAFFAGRRFGRRKLASRVSPGKSVEGVVGGVALAAGVVVVYTSWRPVVPAPAPAVALLAAVTALASVLGDLLESLVKRRAGRKDSGVLVPGHGGVLDRIDSLTAAAPVFALGLILLGATR